MRILLIGAGGVGDAGDLDGVVAGSKILEQRGVVAAGGEREGADLREADLREVPALAEVGDDRSGLFKIYRHRERMLSLEKAYTETELRAFVARAEKALGKREVAFVVEPKFDGLAVSVTFERGRLVRAVTRGNGVEGDDVTAPVRAIAGLPRALRGPAGGEGAANNCTCAQASTAAGRGRARADAGALHRGGRGGWNAAASPY